MAAALELDRVSKTWGAMRAVDNVSLRIEAGERVALIGASGSGKSTLIRIASGLALADPTSGGVRSFGLGVQDKGKLSSEVRRARRQIGLVFQQFALVGRLTVMTNVLVGVLGRISRLRGTLGLFNDDEKRTALAALAEVGIAQHAGKKARELSGGQQQRVAIARALVQGAKLVLADEPIASLDPKSAKRVMDTLVTMSRDHGIALVVSLHQVDYATAYFDRVIAMNAGRVVFDGPASRITSAFLTELYGASAEELILPSQFAVPAAAVLETTSSEPVS
ncbi:phosphonate ABC transporter ATP-binding protein [Ancylobacter defluvii]|uniref:Phosphonates import ATP-binding protein PhnC 2 n=1 Tax=Ancylobacter defluvii TaxID=1282440 RepID=A0A9W6JW56_9HYPH|nr:phosphonate ABC transporter ATP-binding protein [Ancylobacter defluvii]MBS7589376.1 phosphonate ABC transporter ATP-binding protein [Ancylobacter defluvii]GLK84990.1 phosphonates import ATP-binding protein PhnC 2 [Ancylobacter defluvii]